jgi:hypothetical protein
VLVRNYYRSPAITKIVRMSVELLKEDSEAFGVRRVGYIAAVAERQTDDSGDRRAAQAGRLRVRALTGAERCRECLTCAWSGAIAWPTVPT